MSPRQLPRLRSGSSYKGPEDDAAGQSPRVPAKAPESPLAKMQTELLRTPKYTGLTVVCGDRSWQCQRSILSQRCHFFCAALKPGYCEAETRIIHLPDDDPDAIDTMLLHIYTLEAPDFTNTALFPQPSLAAASLFKISDKYNLPVLRDAAKGYFLGLIRKSLPTWNQLNAQNRSLWTAWIPVFWSWTMEGSDEIRDAVIDALVKISKSIIDDESFQRVLASNIDITLTLLKTITQKAKFK